MHVLPLPFGLALALLPRREADRLRRQEVKFPVVPERTVRDAILGDLRYFRPV